MDAVTSGLVYGNSSGNGASASIAYVTGTTSSTIVWPQGSIPSTFTVCSLTRYTGSTNARILNSVSNNWFHGHWSNRRGMAYYQGTWQMSQSSYGLNVNNCELISFHWIFSFSMPLIDFLFYNRNCFRDLHRARNVWKKHGHNSEQYTSRWLSCGYR